MNRRAFVRSLASAVAGVGLAAGAQAPPMANRQRRVVWLQGGAAEPEYEKQVDDALAEAGWTVGKIIRMTRH